MFLTTGGAGPECQSVLKRLAVLIANKRNDQYGNFIGYIRTKIRFSLLKSVLVSLRGIRGKQFHREQRLSSIDFNLIPEVYDYEI